MRFLNEGKTERECTDRIVNDAEAEGFRDWSRLIGEKKQLKPGDLVYSVWMNKSVVAFEIGEAPMERGTQHTGRPHRFAPPRRQAESAL